MIGKLFKHGAAFGKLSKAMSDVIMLLDNYEVDNNSNHIVKAAWATRLGIVDILDEYNYKSTTSIFLTINNSVHRMPLAEALFRSVGRLNVIISTFSDNDQDFLNDMLDKGPCFYKIDKTISLESKKKYMM